MSKQASKSLLILCSMKSEHCGNAFQFRILDHRSFYSSNHRTTILLLYDTRISNESDQFPIPVLFSLGHSHRVPDFYHFGITLFHLDRIYYRCPRPVLSFPKNTHGHFWEQCKIVQMQDEKNMLLTIRLCPKVAIKFGRNEGNYLC